MCVPACTQKTPSVRCRFHQRRLTNTPRRHRLGDGQLSSLYPHQVSARLAPPLVMLCCSAPPACSRTPLRPSVHYPSISMVNIMCIQTSCDHINVLPGIFFLSDLYCVEVRLKLYATNARLIVSPPSLSPSHPPTPPPSRWPALTTLHPLAKFHLVWRRLREALLSSSSLACQKHLSL